MSGVQSKLLGIAAVSVVFISGCGDDEKSGTTVTEVQSNAKTVTESQSTAAPTTAPTSSGDGDPLAGINPPNGSTELSSSQRGDVQYARYSTSESPSAVEAAYKEEFSSAGWSIVSSGGSGGGWGPYGGAEYGLTAKKEDEYADVQAGGEKGHKTYFEVCVGSGARAVCEDLSNEASTKSGGSHGGSDSKSTRSGAS